MTYVRWAVVLSLAVSLLFAVWRPSDGGGVMTGFEGRTLDARFLLRGARQAPDTVAILAIDDATLAGTDAFPPPRSLLADGLRAALQGGAAAVAFDLLLTGQGVGDAQLEAALAGTDRAILAVSFRDGGAVALDAQLETALVRSALPLVVGAPAAGAGVQLAPDQRFVPHAWLAHVNVQREADGALRRLPLLLQAGPGIVLPALSLQAARLAQGTAATARWGAEIEVAGQRLAIDRQNEMAIDFYGPTGTLLTTSLLDAAEAELDGRIVFIGATASGFGDRFSTPFARDMPGVEVLASAAANIVSGKSLRRDDLTWGIDVLLAGMVALSGVFAASRGQPAVSLMAAGVVWLGALSVLHLSFLQGLWLDGATLLAALGTATLCGAVARFLQQRQAATNLGRYQSPLLKSALADQARPAFDGRVQPAAILFADLAGFTTRSQALGPVATTTLLRDFHQSVETAATSHSGLVEQYAGDGVMICFGLPEPGPSDAANALACAEALFAGLAWLNQRPGQLGQPPLEMRIGVHFGDVSAAVLGGANHSHVTFVGDVVNSASRLQDVAKTLDAELVVSADLVAAVGNVADHRLSFAGEVQLRGRDAAMPVWIRPQERRPQDPTR